MSWYVGTEHNFSAMEQAGFMCIVENAIRRHGRNERHNVAEEVLAEVRKEWPAAGQDWVVCYNTNGQCNILCFAHKSIDLRQSNGDFMYAARI